MALQSQAPRAGTSRRYTTTSRKGSKGLAPWLALIGVAVVLVGLYMLFGNNDDASKQANAAGPDSSAGADADSAGQSLSAGQITPAPQRSGATDASTRPRTTTTTQQATTTQTPDRVAGPAALAAANSPERKLEGEAKDQFELGMQRLEAGDYVVGRALLSELLFRDGALPRNEAQGVRERLAALNEQHVLARGTRSSEQINADPILTIHKVQGGEYLSTIANTYRTPYQLIERINSVKAERLQAGQALQVIKGPVHARVDKSDYRMDLYVVDADGLPIYLKSYTVGLGEFDSTPIGQYHIKPGSKVGPDAAGGKGPSWRNPRTGKVYDSADPDIPIGEYWMALEGIDEKTKGKEGYGIHATNDPNSIGRQESMGCIRMRDEDVDQVFYTLFEGASTVEIVP